MLFDAFVIRLIIVPSVMYQLGNANWWLPAWMGRILPNVAVESEEDASFEAAEIDDIPDEAVPTPSERLTGRLHDASRLTGSEPSDPHVRRLASPMMR